MSPAKNGNIKKYYSYKLAWERINAAIEYQFPVEAIAFEESIMSDRLRAYAEHVKKDFKKNKRYGITPLLGIFEKELEKRHLCNKEEYQELSGKIREWITKRNSFIHAIVKTDRAGAPLDNSAEEFLDKAMESAKEGAKLARKLQTLIRRAEVSQEVKEP